MFTGDSITKTFAIDFRSNVLVHTNFGSYEQDITYKKVP